MPPKPKFTKEEIIKTSVEITRKDGIDAITAREIGSILGASTRPIFTYFESMDEVKKEVRLFARDLYCKYVLRGIAMPIPFLGVGLQILQFAKEEPELYRLLFLTKNTNPDEDDAMTALEYSQSLVREPIQHIYNMDAETANRYFRDIWLVCFSLATLVVTGACAYSDEEMGSILTEVSVSVCKAYKEIPGLAKGAFDRDAVFGELVKK